MVTQSLAELDKIRIPELRVGQVERAQPAPPRICQVKRDAINAVREVVLGKVEGGDHRGQGREERCAERSEAIIQISTRARVN